MKLKNFGNSLSIDLRLNLLEKYMAFSRKMAQKIAEYEEQLEALLNKCSSLEKQKSRLQSEVEVLIMDLEKATTHAQQLEKRCAQLEKLNLDLKVREIFARKQLSSRNCNTSTKSCAIRKRLWPERTRN